MTLLASPHTLEEVFAAFADGVARLVRFDAISVALLDAERGAFESFDLAAGALRGSPAPGTWTPLEGTLLERVVATGAPVRIDDLEHDETPEASRRVFADLQAPVDFAETVEMPGIAFALSLPAPHDAPERIDPQHFIGARGNAYE